MSLMKVNCSMKVLDYEEINDSFDNATIAIAYTGKNRNHSYISKEAFIDALPTLKNVPVVGHYDKEADSFGEHDYYYETDDKGNVNKVNLTVPFGVIPESAKQWFEDVEINGETKEMLVTNALLWKRQVEYEKIKESGTLDQSMEIDCEEYSLRKDGYIDISKFTFTALCIIESAPPCYEGASINMEYDLNNFKMQYSLMLNELKELGGKMEVKDKKDETFSEDTETNVNETEKDFSVNEEVQEKENDSNDKEKDFSKENKETKNNKREEVFSSYKTKYDDLEKLVATLNMASENYDDPYYYMCDFDDSYVYMKDLFTYENPKYFRVKYVTLKEVNGENEEETGYKLDGDLENIFKVFITENEYNDIKESGIEPIQAEFKKYVEKYPEKEFTSLREYKASKEKDERIKGENELFSKFDKKLEKSKEYEELKKNKEKYSLDELEHECLYIVGKFSLNSDIEDDKNEEENEHLSFSVIREDDSSNDDVDDYGGILKHFE